MTDLPSNRAYIQVEETDSESPVSEQTLQKIGSAINFLNDFLKTFEEFTSSGSFTVPEGVERLFLYGWGGGGGGLVNGSLLTSGFVRGSCGAFAYFKVVSVTPGDVISITIGAGGAGGGTSGSDGGNTSFGSLATFEGGSGAITLSANDDNTGLFVTLLSSVSGTGSARYAKKGGNSFFQIESGANLETIYPGAYNGFIPPEVSSNANQYRGGTGGGGIGGAGASSGNASSAAANTGAGGGSTTSGTAGSGGSGYLLIGY